MKAISLPRTALLPLAALLLGFFTTGCLSDNPASTDPGTQPDTVVTNNNTSNNGNTRSGQSLTGTWIYVGGTMWHPDGRSSTAVVSGEITFNTDGTWIEYRETADIMVSNEGRFTLTGDRLELVETDGTEYLNFRVAFGEEIDRESGRRRRTLVLNGEPDPDETWYDFGLRERL